MMDRKLRFNKAFSLTETMLVLAIMAILSGLLHVNIKSRRQEAEIKNIVECVKIYEATVQMFYLHNNGVFPIITNEAKLESVEALERFRPENFSTDSLIKSESCTGVCYYISGIKIAIKIELQGNATKFRDKVVKVLKEHCIADQVSYGTGYIYYYLRDNEGTIYI